MPLEENGGSRCQVLIVGSVALDTVSTPFGTASEALGGAATYAGVAASFYAPVRLVAVIGEDFPPEHLDRLAARGIDLQGLRRQAGRTFRWAGYYEYDMSQAHTVSTQLNVFEGFSPQIPESYRDTPYVFLANIDPDLQLRVLSQMRQPRLTICDTMDYWIAGKRDQLLAVLSRVDIALMNDAEARQLCGTPSLVSAARQLLALGPSTVIIKKGEHGAVMFTPDSHFSAPGYPLEEVRDPTGAGDSFAGGLIGYLAYTDDPTEDNLRKAVIYGSVMASFNVEDFSLNRFWSLRAEGIVNRYREFSEITRFAPA